MQYIEIVIGKFVIKESEFHWRFHPVCLLVCVRAACALVTYSAVQMLDRTSHI